jgi:hypothetical protein
MPSERDVGPTASSDEGAVARGRRSAVGHAKELVEGAKEVAAQARDQATRLVDAALEKVFHAPLDVRSAAEATAMLEGNGMDKIFAYGLHEFLTEFIARNNKITEAVAESYNFY